MSRPLRILVVEDNEVDFMVLEYHLKKQGLDTVCLRVDSNAQLDAALAGEWSLVLADFNVPGMNFDATLNRIKSRQPDLPIILVSGGVGEETAVELLHGGLADFVLKGSPHRLAPAIERALDGVRERAARRQAESSLRQSEAQLHALTARLQAVREEERTRIARDVHDVLGQLLTGLTLDMAWLQKRLRNECESALQEAITDKFGEIKQLTDQMIQTVQEIASDMRPSVLDNLGLSSAVRFESGRFQKRTGIACQTEVVAPAPALTPERSTGVFRIFQEILTNIARHASASEVRIRLGTDGDRLVLAVRDNGRGITPEQLADHASLGLLGMRERAGQIGAEIRFVGEPGLGTTVTLELPL